MQKWYAVMSKPRQEQAAITFLEQTGIETYYPEINESFSVKGRRCLRRSGLFPGYFFAKFDYNEKHRIVSYCRGIRKIVAFGHVPAEVDPGLLREIRVSLETQDVVELPRFRQGDLVRISHGPFVGIKAVFESAMPRKDRVVVLLGALSCQSRAELQLSDIEQFSVSV